jgi:3-hydroxymyristoyl/3-hydroxydecanoyl-(acyl carrier protein) dehydratase
MIDMRQSLETIMTGDEWPTLLGVEELENQVNLSLEVDANLHWLKGHFPAQPVLPGVVQTHWAAQLAQHFFATATAPRRIDNLKFQNVVLPPQQCTLQLIANADTTSIHFRYTDPATPGHIFSEGKLIFRE